MDRRFAAALLAIFSVPPLACGSAEHWGPPSDAPTMPPPSPVVKPTASTDGASSALPAASTPTAPPASATPIDTAVTDPGGPTDASTLKITIDKGGAITVDGSRVANDTALEERVKAFVAKHPDARATIAADKDVTHGRVVAILDKLKQAGVTKVAFAVSPP